mgnify:CR=1 FL=1
MAVRPAVMWVSAFITNGCRTGYSMERGAQYCNACSKYYL